jgi:hypothetical protein
MRANVKFNVQNFDVQISNVQICKYLRASFIYNSSAHSYICIFAHYFYTMSRLDKYRQLPVFKKAKELLELAEAIVEAIKEDDKKEWLAGEIVGNAMLIQAKIANAEGGGLYSLRMQNAVLIRYAVYNMLNGVISAEMFGLNNDDYVQLMRDKVEEFRIEFVAWIRGLDKSNDIPDNWAIRFDTSTPEQEKLEELMFDDDKFDFDNFDDDDFNIDEDDKDEE